MYDVLIIGGGVVGCAAAWALSAYDLSVCLAERESDICEGTSKANSGIVHAGFNETPGTGKMKYGSSSDFYIFVTNLLIFRERTI